MELALFFAEVDTQPWAELQHAYGSAADVPDCLRALAGDEDEASEALSELYGSILHQGSVYEATARAVPYLARLAEAGHRTEDLLVMLGGIAEGGEDRGETDEAACRAAVVGQLPLVLGWIADEKPGLRQAAAWTAAMTGESGQVLPVLRRRWAQETDPLVRAELLGAMAHLDPAGTATEATEAMGAGEPGEVRIAALLAGVDAGRPWTPAHHDAMLALLPADGLVSSRLDQERNEPLQYVVESLLLRDAPADREAAYALLDAALRSPEPDARTEALWAAETACRLSRSAPERLAAPVRALITDPAAVPAAYPLLKKLGAHGAAAAPVLARLAAGRVIRRTGLSKPSSRSHPRRPRRSSPATWGSARAHSVPHAASLSERRSPPRSRTTPNCWTRSVSASEPAISKGTSRSGSRSCSPAGGAGRPPPCRSSGPRCRDSRRSCRRRWRRCARRSTARRRRNC